MARNYKRPKYNPLRIVVGVVGLAVIAGGIFWGVKFVQEKKEAQSIVVEEGTEFLEIESEYEEYVESLPDAFSYGIDGDSYSIGSVLSDFLGNGWEIVGNPYDPEWVFDGNSLEPEEEYNLLLSKGEQLICVNIMNTSSAETKVFEECMIFSVTVSEGDGHSVNSVAVNGEDVWGLSVTAANEKFGNQSEDAGECFYYYDVPEELSRHGDLTVIGLMVIGRSEAGTGMLDFLNINMDYQFNQ